MRVWADVYDANGTLVGGPITSLTGASVTRALDGAGSISLTFPAADERAVTLLQNERRVRLYVEHDEQTRELGRGIVRQLRANVAESSTTFSASGPDSLDVLARRSVLLNRSYENQSVSDIANDLAGLAGWTAVVDFGVGNQTCRFDGSNVLKALLRVAEEKGLHLREGESDNTLEIGAFGTNTGVRCLAPTSLTREVYANDDLILIESITQTTDSKDICNWIVPIGAGEGAAALTLRYSNRLGTYAIEQVLGPDGQVLYYLRDTESIATYGQCERIVTFKEIGPVANSTTAKQLAANALYDAAVAWLERQAVPLTTYKINGKKCRTTIRPGDKVRVTYQGVVQTLEGEYTPILIDELMWVMKVTESVGTDGLRLSLDVATVDRKEQDTAQAVVGALEAINVRNVSVQTFPYWSENTYTDTVCYQTSIGIGKYAYFKLQFDDSVTDIVRVVARFKTRPLFALNRVTAVTPSAGSNIDNVFDVVEGSEHPKGLHLYFNSVDVSSDYGGPWNPTASDNTALDVTVDLTQLVIDAGIYNEHLIEFRAEVGDTTPAYQLPGYAGPGLLTGQRSSGVIELNLRVLGTARAVVPS